MQKENESRSTKTVIGMLIEKKLNCRKRNQAALEIGIKVFTNVGIQKLRSLQIGEEMY